MGRNYKGLKYDMMIEWENGETTSKPPALIATDDPVTCVFYAAENNLLELNESLTRIEERGDDRTGKMGRQPPSCLLSLARTTL